MLDQKNQVLFEHLLAYARFPVKQLARLIHSSEATVVNRIRQLEQKGFIARYDAIINWQKLPFIKKIYHFRLNPTEESACIAFLLKEQPVFSIIRTAGFANLQAWCFFASEKQCHDFEKAIRSFAYDCYDIAYLEILRSSFFNLPLQLKVPPIREQTLSLKPIDISIMKWLAAGNARASLLEVSKKLKLPYDAVHYHATNLLKSGYFSQLIAQPGESAFTLQTTALVIKLKTPGLEKKLYPEFARCAKIRSLAYSKTNELIIHFFSLNFSEYQKKLNQLLSIPDRKEILTVSSCHWTRVIINNRYPLEYFLFWNRHKTSRNSSFAKY